MNLPPGQRFDSIVVDEAWDFADSWWGPLLAALKDPDTGGIYVFSDEGPTRLRSAGHASPVPLVPLILDQNIRNTARSPPPSSLWSTTRCVTSVATGQTLSSLPCARDDVMDAGDDQIDKLSTRVGGPRTSRYSAPAAGTRNRSPARQRVSRSIRTASGMWIRSSMATYSASKDWNGAVVLVVNDKGAFDRSRERLYAGLSRRVTSWWSAATRTSSHRLVGRSCAAVGHRIAVLLFQAVNLARVCPRWACSSRDGRLAAATLQSSQPPGNPGHQHSSAGLMP